MANVLCDFQNSPILERMIVEWEYATPNSLFVLEHILILTTLTITVLITVHNAPLYPNLIGMKSSAHMTDFWHSVVPNSKITPWTDPFPILHLASGIYRSENIGSMYLYDKLWATRDHSLFTSPIEQRDLPKELLNVCKSSIILEADRKITLRMIWATD